MTQSIDDIFKQLCENLKAEFGSGLKYYGEGVRSLSTNSASNFITADYSEPCSVNDAFNQTIFLVRENATPLPQIGTGRNKVLSRSVDFRLIANTKSIFDEYRITSILNQSQKITYNSTSFEQDAVARGFFGINERNTESAFFSISFSVMETIVCKPCK